MVDVKTETKNGGKNEGRTDKKHANPRDAIREARKRRLRVIESGQPPKTIKVFAANEAMRDVLRHSGGARFRDALDQGVEWPNDSFTKRRIADGSVLTEAPSGNGESAPVDESLNPREQAAARKPKQESKSEAQQEQPSREKSERSVPRHQPEPHAAT